MFEMTDDEFEGAIEEALDSIPERFLSALEDVAIVMVDEPDERHVVFDDGEDFAAAPSVEVTEGGGGIEGGEGNGYGEEPVGEVLGFYDGVPLTERNDEFDVEIPDVITIFKGPHERSFDSRDEIVSEIGKTVIHEIGHYFGLDDERLHEMGY